MSALKSFFIDPRHKEKRDFLKKLPIFQGLGNTDITHLLGVLQEKKYLKDEILFAENDIGRALFIVVSGKINLSMTQTDGTPKFLAEVKPGEIFGEMALLEEMPRTTAATAAEKTEVHMLYKNKLDSLIYNYPKIGIVIMHYLARTLSARLRYMIELQNKISPAIDRR